MSSVVRLFDGQDVAAVYRGPALGPDVAGSPLVVTFAPRSNRNALTAPGFGQKFLAKYDYAAVHVTVSRNHWYQIAEMDAALDAIAPVAAQFDRVVTYGSSMGGHAALLFAGRLRARAIALSPLFSIDPGIMPGDARYRGDLVHFDGFRYSSALMEGAVGHVVYDPFSPDRPHIERIKAGAHLTLLPAGLSGHPSTRFLADTGLLSTLVRAIIDGSDPRPIMRMVRTHRRRSWRYWLKLSGRARRLRHRKLAIQAAKRALRLAPDRPEVKRALDLARGPVPPRA